ncbi:MAG: GAF domain-containing protein [Anaerolineae bacterium]
MMNDTHHQRPLPATLNISAEQIQLLLTVATVVSQSLDPKEVAEVALKLACRATGLQTGMVLVLQPEQPIILASRGLALDWLHQFQAATRRFKGAIISRVLEAGEPTVFSNLRLVPDNGVTGFFQQAQLNSLACLPLQVPGNIPGVMLIGSREERQFEPSEVDFLQAVSGQINIGLRNAWLYAQSQRQLEELESVTEAARAVVSSFNLDQILTRIMEEVTTRLNTEAAALLLLEPRGQELEFAAVAGPKSANLKGVRLPVGHGIAGWVAQNDRPVLVPDVSRDERFYKGLDQKTGTVTRSVICVPLRARSRLIGVVEVINKKRGQFSRADQRLLESLATFAAVAIENARMYQEANQQLEQATLYARDFSTTYKKERQQREALDKLRYSFLNVVSHELKTPLTVILQGLEALKNPRRGPLNAEQSEMITMLNRQSSYLRRLIDGLITFATFSARQGTMKFKPVPFGAVLDEALALSKFKATRKHIALRDERPPALPTLSLDKDRMSEAVGHLIDNAIKFSPDGEPVTVRTELDGPQLVLRVVDRGQGLPAGQLDGIWDSFTQLNTTLERGLEGLGLGLAIARYIVEAHDGTISVASEPGKGSEFTIRLPCNNTSTQVS